MSFDESRFRRNVQKALDRARTVLDNNRRPSFAADVAHEYEDKYLLAEFVTNTSLAAFANVLVTLGLNEKDFDTIKQWSKNRSVTLRFKAEESCTFLREETRTVESATQHVTEWSGDFNEKRVDKTVTKITEWFWRFDVSYTLFFYQGSDVEKGGPVLQTRKGSIELKTTTSHTPHVANTVRPAIDLNVTWALQHMDSLSRMTFTIDRLVKSCHTPRRNSEVTAALSMSSQFSSWGRSLASYLQGTLFPVDQQHGLDLKSLNDDSLFSPVVPLFEDPSVKRPAEDNPEAAPEEPSKSTEDDKKKGKADEKKAPSKAITIASSGSRVLPLSFLGAFLNEQKRSISEKLKELAEIFPANNKIVTVAEANLIVLSKHLQTLDNHYQDGVDYIEDMLRKQLIAAIGKEVLPADFTNYLRYHNRKLFKPEFQPKPFCFAVRRPQHYPEGTVTIEEDLLNGSMPEPIHTTVSVSTATRPMKFPLDAATNVSFYGQRYLHGWVSHQFSSSTTSKLDLLARTRQFSSFILLVGKIVGPDQFDPTAGIIIQNKDDIRIPLLLETIPSPKQFRDAISSLSPEQQRFARAFRSMQLESSVFAVCVIQIKPQLEKLLKLPHDSLTKEIQMTQDLMKLFIEYQIPSDLISYDGPEVASVREKVTTVQGYMKKMQQMIADSKRDELQEATLRATKSVLDSFSPQAGSVVVPPRAHGTRTTARQTSSRAAKSTSKSGQGQVATEPKADVEEDLSDVIDFTQVPVQMDEQFARLDEDGALQATILKASTSWVKRYQASLLSPQATTNLGNDELVKEKQKTFDLLDALTKSGVLAIDAAELHVVVAATHVFDKTLLNTLVQDNINPIEKVERSSLIVASTIHGVTPPALIKEDHVERLQEFSPVLFLEDKKADDAFAIDDREKVVA